VPHRRDGSLTDRLPVVAVLRLVVTRGGRLLYGEAIDAETEQTKRFSGWRGMDPAIRTLVGTATARLSAGVTGDSGRAAEPSASAVETE
jgi:hypothetical protein